MKKNVIFLSLVFLLLTSNSCCNMFGSYDLGNNFTMLSGDGDKQEIIIYCSPNRETRCCDGGSRIIPSFDDYYNGDYVEDVEFDNHWIIILIVNAINNSKSYWIIDKDFELEERYKNWPMSKEDGEAFDKIIKSHVYGPFDHKTFTKKKEELGIKIKF